MTEATGPTYPKPTFCNEEQLERYLRFLDELRKRKEGSLDMLAAGAPLRKAFSLKAHESHKVLMYWMDTFGTRHPQQAKGTE
jgi:hypothetical protein